MLGKIKVMAGDLLRKREERQLFDKIVNTNRNVSVFNMDKVYDARKHGFSLTESACFGLNEGDLGEYISTWEAYQPRRCENPYFILSDDKMLFSFAMENVVDVPHIYGQIISGKVISMTHFPLTNDNIYDFFLKNNGGVLKARSGYNGFGIHVYTTDGGSLFEKGQPVTREELTQVISKEEKALIQSRMEQGQFETRIYPHSINTIRVISMRRKDANEHEIVAAVQRIGTDRSAPMDNFSQGGGSALIDLETGELSSMTCFDSIDSQGKRVFYDRHPDTNTQIKGEKIPNWDKVKSAIVDITRMRPFFDYIAWDIVLKDDGIAVIETNMKSALTVFQSHKGLRNSLLGEKYREFGYIKD